MHDDIRHLGKFKIQQQATEVAHEVKSAWVKHKDPSSMSYVGWPLASTYVVSGMYALRHTHTLRTYTGPQ